MEFRLLSQSAVTTLFQVLEWTSEVHEVYKMAAYDWHGVAPRDVLIDLVEIISFYQLLFVSETYIMLEEIIDWHELWITVWSPPYIRSQPQTCIWASKGLLKWILIPKTRLLKRFTRLK